MLHRATVHGVLALLLSVLPSRASAQEAGTTRALNPATYKAIQDRLAGAANLTVFAPDTLESGRLAAATFTYGAEGQRYGGGVAAWNLQADSLLWEIHQDGDYPVHISRWLDANGDGQSDFLSSVGEDDYFSTTIYVNRLRSFTAYDSAAFVEAFHSTEAYSTFLDLNEDGVPEILTPGEPVSASIDDIDGPCQSLVIPPRLSDEAMREYQRHVGPFASANFTYGISAYAPLTLHLFSPIRLFHIQGAKAVEVTAELPAHLRWRSHWLRAVVASAPPSCRQPIRRLWDYFAAYIKSQ